MSETILSDYPASDGVLLRDESLASRTWLGVGGKADLYFEPADEDALARFVTSLAPDMPLTILGAGSNMLIRDGGLAGAVIKLTGPMAEITQTGETITAGAGATDAELARFAARNNRAGLAFLISIPGTIGGGLRMNAGCYGSEFKDVVMHARMMDRTGAIHEMSPQQMGMRYRHSDVPEDMIFLSATFATRAGEGAGDGVAIKAEMKEMLAMRAATQPQGVRTGGSTFANPDGHKAWQVIDKAGCRGKRIGDASMSEKHCNFLINHGAATAHDLEALGTQIVQDVRAHSGIELRWELKRLGRDVPREAPRDAPRDAPMDAVTNSSDGVQ